MKEHDFCAYLQESIRESREKKPYFTASFLAQKTRIHASYLSSVVKGKAFLQADQAFLMAEALQLNPKRRDYFLLLNEFHRSQLPSRKEKLRQELDRLYEMSEGLGSHLKAEPVGPTNEDLVRYFLNPRLMLLHLYLSVENPRLDSFAKSLSLSDEELSQLIEELEKLELIRMENGQCRVLRHHLHLERESPWCEAHQKLIQDLGRLRLEKTDLKDQQKYCVSFSANDESFGALQKLLLKFMEDAEKIVISSGKEKIYQLNVEFFPWL